MRAELDIEGRLLALAEAQHGVLARSQLLELGLSPSRIGRWIDRRRLLPVTRGVYALGHRPPTDLARWRAATLSRGPAAVLGGLSAGALWQLGIDDRGLSTVIVPGPSGRSQRAGQLLVRSVDLPPAERTAHRGVPVTSLARTLVDLGALVSPGRLRRAVEQSDRLELFDRRAVMPILERRAGRPGVAALAGLLDDAARHGLPRTRSLLEADFIEFCRSYELPRPQVNRYDGTQEVDFRWPAARIVVETDGWRFHRDRAAFERDALRSQRLAAEGWTVVRVTWRQLGEDPAGVAQRLRAMLVARSLPAFTR